ncbi:uncharacterized protein [Littorina saxatilis]|uniref:Uncharacterized protein n=1 Tax=Littorina saxatilis TaxID=31220 RepID=A0AAN9GFV6_9CAEN
MAGNSSCDDCEPPGHDNLDEGSRVYVIAGSVAIVVLVAVLIALIIVCEPRCRRLLSCNRLLTVRRRSARPAYPINTASAFYSADHLRERDDEGSSSSSRRYVPVEDLDAIAASGISATGHPTSSNDLFPHSPPPTPRHLQLKMFLRSQSPLSLSHFPSPPESSAPPLPPKMGSVTSPSLCEDAVSTSSECMYTASCEPEKASASSPYARPQNISVRIKRKSPCVPDDISQADTPSSPVAEKHFVF